MTHHILFSAPSEKYIDHINGCLEKLNIVLPIWEFTIRRIFSLNKNDKVVSLLQEMIIFHDIGKLTKKWQKIVQQEAKENKNLSKPSHAPIGAAYLYKKFSKESLFDLKIAIVFAVAIHHTDSGLLGDNIEKPDVQAILDGIVDSDGKIIWSDEAITLPKEFFPQDLNNLTVKDLKEMAISLRLWAKSGSLLVQHKKRIQVSLLHHILKLVDVSSASERKEYQKDNDQDLYGGWLMVENIKKYINNLQIRSIAEEIRKKFNPQKIILFGSYAYGIPKKDSDIDLLVIMETKLKFYKQAALIRSGLPSFIPINIIVRTPKEVEKRLSMEDFFIKTIIEKGVCL